MSDSESSKEKRSKSFLTRLRQKFQLKVYFQSTCGNALQRIEFYELPDDFTFEQVDDDTGFVELTRQQRGNIDYKATDAYIVEKGQWKLKLEECSRVFNDAPRTGAIVK